MSDVPNDLGSDPFGLGGLAGGGGTSVPALTQPATSGPATTSAPAGSLIDDLNQIKAALGTAQTAKSDTQDILSQTENLLGIAPPKAAAPSSNVLQILAVVALLALGAVVVYKLVKA